ncbi:putative quinol monooxygenase [Deinococcus radiopugnans]|uniref:Antibiotic biosynthesis monooxygenase n=1 Tax=Deinococcus radiopugnans ATCC 19172 TaxID=585398 RepID=A0A5C4Y744_9DEIO|nr:putative quinol monooxygenase [Deinococcus radiopugnans]MBB6016287.1 quinol monooxygenase YgiN [Deinococcus radiopugnans ATCC 19172]QLG12156.1 antibiotic biosynthesis monooxygenase [Deinococcus sp. D7000]TNM71257.1 antibiotic biosynthesis monooxygenase [Deinococcus radiopugnans ATCC 19172]
MILSHGTLTAPAAHADAIRALLRQIAQATRQEAGCRLYLVSENLETPGHFVISEQWDSLEAMQTHLAQPGVGEAVAAVHGMGVTDLTITAWEAGAQTDVM